MESSRLRELLDYNPETGLFKWRVSRGTASAGSIAGSKGEEGYICIGIDGSIYKAHRLAWLYSHGVLPDEQIDHENCIRDDNRLTNLRIATPKGNADNASKRSDNKSGVKGVSWKASHSKWVAQASHMGKVKHLGIFEDLEDAKRVVMEFREKNHKEFVNHG